MKNNKKPTLEQIQNESLWVVKFTYGHRDVRTHEHIDYADENIRDVDLACKQPDHLVEFFNDYYEYQAKNGWTTIPEFYEKWGK